ncbi:MAG TPA: outer membrane lipoprotein-sorting protein [Candidatus Acidoferrum sp.]|nr:outer membrane lipoprotein-sorting protein [Candidatus Acidoferrum sp.]
MTKRRLIPWIFSLGAMAIAIGAGAAQTPSKWTIESVLAMMDRSAKGFRSLTADIENIKYTAVVKDTSTETGKIWVRHDQKMRIEFTKPEPRTILRTGNSLFLYNPKLNRVEEYDLGKNSAMVDQYIRLGFGTKSEDLKKSYLVTVTGEEELDKRKTVLLELTPKSEQMRNQITRIQMWIDEATWLPIQQKFYETGSGDYILFHYTNPLEDLKINESEFKQDWPKNASHEKPHV